MNSNIMFDINTINLVIEFCLNEIALEGNTSNLLLFKLTGF